MLYTKGPVPECFSPIPSRYHSGLLRLASAQVEDLDSRRLQLSSPVEFFKMLLLIRPVGLGLNVSKDLPAKPSQTIVLVVLQDVDDAEGVPGEQKSPSREIPLPKSPAVHNLISLILNLRRRTADPDLGF